MTPRVDLGPGALITAADFTLDGLCVHRSYPLSSGGMPALTGALFQGALGSQAG